jgi:hypothetical protein
MQPTRLAKLQSQLRSRLWLIGGWLRRRAARQLVEAAAQGDRAAIVPLAGVVADGDDPAVWRIAVAAPRALTSQDCVERLDSPSESCSIASATLLKSTSFRRFKPASLT